MTTERDEAIDAFRGLAIVMMLPANYLEHIVAVPAALKHAPDIGLTVIDFIAPFFLFAVGLTWPGALRRRHARDGFVPTLEHVLRRSFALIGIGALFSLGEAGYGFNQGFQWGTLQAIGAASLVSAPFVALAPGRRLGAGLLLLGAYQLGLDRLWLPTVLAAPQAGLPGVLAWAALLVLATVAADWLGPFPRRVAGLGVLALAAGAALAWVFPVSKHRMSVSFVLIVFGAAVLAFLAVRALSRRRVPLGALVTWGRNPLVLYCAHLVLLGAFLVPEARWWHAEAPPGQAALQFAVYAGLLHLLATTLARRRIVITL